MIEFDNGMLVLDNTTTRSDVDAIDTFADHVRKEERDRIIKLLEKLSCDECDMNGFENDIPNRAIALIKGEQK